MSWNPGGKTWYAPRCNKICPSVDVARSERQSRHRLSKPLSVRANGDETFTKQITTGTMRHGSMVTTSRQKSNTSRWAGKFSWISVILKIAKHARLVYHWTRTINGSVAMDISGLFENIVACLCFRNDSSRELFEQTSYIGHHWKARVVRKG